MKVVVANIAKSIQIKELLNRTAKQMVHREPLVFQLGQKSFAALLKYGVAVYWNVSEKQKLAFDERIAPFLVDSYQAVEVDEPEIVLREKKQGVYEGKICLKAVDVETAALVSLVLGRALALEGFERDVEKTLLHFDVVMQSFAFRGKTSLSTRDLLKQVGFAMHTQHALVSQISLLDRPDIVWDEPELARLYDSLALEYELEDRYDILTEKLKLMYQNVEFILDYLDTRKGHMLEWAIILLIVFEIGLFLYELFG